MEKAYEGDLKSLEILFKEGIRLALSVASKYTDKSADLAYYTSKGFTGFLKAMESYHSSEARGKGEFKFTTYATWFMKKEVEKSLEEK